MLRNNKAVINDLQLFSNSISQHKFIIKNFYSGVHVPLMHIFIFSYFNPFSVETVFIRQNRYSNESERANYDNYKLKKNLVSMIYTKIFQRCEGDVKYTLSRMKPWLLLIDD